MCHGCAIPVMKVLQGISNRDIEVVEWKEGQEPDNGSRPSFHSFMRMR